MSLKEKTMSGMVWSLVQRWSARLWGLLIFFILARLLGPEVFGLVAYAAVFVDAAAIILGQGFVKALVQRRDLEPLHTSTAFWSNIVTGAALTLLVWITAPLISHLASQPELSPILRWLALGFTISAFANVQTALLQRDLAYKSLAVRTLLGLVAGGLVGVGMAFSGYGVWSLVAQQLVTITLSTIVLWFLSAWRPERRFSWQHFKDLFSFEANSLGTRALNFVNRRSDNLLIGFFLGPVALGLYTVAYRVYYIVSELFSSAISQAAFSALSRAQDDTARMRRAFYSLIEMVSFIAFPAFIGLAFVAPILVPLAFGEEWTESVLVLQILCGVGIIQAVLIFNFAVVSASGKPQWEFKYGMLSATINLVSFLSVVKFGIEAVAAAYTIRAYVLAPVSVHLVKRLINISYRSYLKLFAAPLAASSVMSGVLYSVLVLTSDFFPTLRLFILVGAGSASYLLSVKLFAPSLFEKVYDLTKTMLPSRYRLEAKG